MSFSAWARFAPVSHILYYRLYYIIERHAISDLMACGLDAHWRRSGLRFPWEIYIGASSYAEFINTDPLRRCCIAYLSGAEAYRHRDDDLHSRSYMFIYLFIRAEIFLFILDRLRKYIYKAGAAGLQAGSVGSNLSQAFCVSFFLKLVKVNRRFIVVDKILNRS